MIDFDTLNINLGIERVTHVLNELGNLHLKFKSIHVAGTNGKGSVCAMLNSILIEAGYKVGLFTSPHLFKWNERIKVQGDDISGDNFKHQTTNIKLKAEELKLELTPFEIVTCAAFQYFAEQKIDYAVVEVGMGGRLDATNVITPEISVITNVDYDHTEYLGKTLGEIANEKAGIIKPGVPVVTAETKPEALDVIKNTCRMQNAKFTPSKSPPYKGGDYQDVPLPLNKGENERGLKGSYQRINKAIAIKIARLINSQLETATFSRRFPVTDKVIAAGLKNTKWPGRFQIISENPLIIVDGAHNPAGARALIESIQELKLGKPITFVLGFQGYKDIQSMIDLYETVAGQIIFTKSSHPQAADLSTKSVPEAIEDAKKIGSPIVIAGSLFLAAEALNYFNSCK